MEEDKIKQAFSKVKEDISNLTNEIYEIKLENIQIKEALKDISNQLNNLQTNSTIRHKISTKKDNSTHNPALRREIGGLKPKNIPFSMGNEGVSTDRQT